MEMKAGSECRSPVGIHFANRRRWAGRRATSTPYFWWTIGLLCVLLVIMGAWIYDVRSWRTSRPATNFYFSYSPSLVVVDTVGEDVSRINKLEPLPLGPNHPTGIRPGSSEIPKAGDINGAPALQDGYFAGVLGSHPAGQPKGIWDAVDQYMCSQSCGDTYYDVIIVGGGVSGLYAAWRLKVAEPSLKIVVIEAEKRTGGRLFSVEMPGMPNISADLGGMHYLADATTILNAWLVEKVFELETRPFPQNASDPKSSAFLRNTRLTADQVSDINVVGKLYHFNAEERKSFTDVFQMYAELFEKTIPDFKDPDLDIWSAKAMDGRQLKDMTMMDLHALLNHSSEMIDFLAAALGYNGDGYSKWSCLKLVGIFKYYILGVEANYRVPVRGMEELPRRLRAEFELMGGKVMTGSPVKAMSTCTQPHQGSHHLLVGDDLIVCSDDVILAVPPLGLQKVWWRTIYTNTAWQGLSSSDAFKLYLGFDRPWWRAEPFGFYEGAEVSTLNIEHTYYIGTQADHPGREAGSQNNNSLVLASYINNMAAYRWPNLDVKYGLEPFRGRPNPFVTGGARLLPNVSDVVVSQAMVDLAMQQLRQLHGEDGKAIPKPYTAVAQWWPSSWYAWNVGVDVTEAIGRISRPDPNDHVFICSSASSKAQGWTEGGLRSTEYVLQTFFKLRPLHGMPLQWIKNYAG